jgi:hypothetical protein
MTLLVWCEVKLSEVDGANRGVAQQYGSRYQNGVADEATPLEFVLNLLCE